MNILYGLVKGFRLTVSIPAAILVHIGYKIGGQSTEWGLVILLFFITGLVMLQNDYFDSEHDKKKGKDFVSKNKSFIQIFLILSWCVVILSSLLFFANQSVFVLPTIGIGIGYSFFRKVLLLPVFAVAILSASPLLLAKLWNSSTELLTFFLCVFLAIFGREIIKDIEDKDIDKGYKNTLLTSNILSEKNATIFAGVLMGIGAIFSLSTAKHIDTLPSYLFYIVGFFLVMVSSFSLICYRSSTKGKKIFDSGMLLFLLALSI